MTFRVYLLMATSDVDGRENWVSDISVTIQKGDLIIYFSFHKYIKPRSASVNFDLKYFEIYRSEICIFFFRVYTECSSFDTLILIVEE